MKDYFISVITNTVRLKKGVPDYLYRAPYDLVVIVTIEGQLAAEEKEHYHTNTPQVSLFAVALHSQDLVGGIRADPGNMRGLPKKCSMVWYGMVWYGMVRYGMVWYGMVWYGMVKERPQRSAKRKDK